MAKSNYLLGFGERYAAPIDHKQGGGDKLHPYEFGVAKQRLATQLADTISAIDDLPKLACPGNQAVMSVIVHPTYVAKTWYPKDFFELAGVTAIGSREVEVKPEAWGVKKHPKTASTTEFFVAADRTQLKSFATEFENLDENVGLSIRKIEKISVPKDLVRDMVSDADHPLLEIALHSYTDDYFVIEGFRDYMESFRVMVETERRIHSGGLCFLPLRAPRTLLPEIQKFAFLRVAREMPSLRIFRPSTVRSRKIEVADNAEIPTTAVIDPSIKVAVFDGGMPEDPDLAHYVRHLELPNLVESVQEFERHGLGVTSALLFGPLEPSSGFARPFASVDHYRVLDANTAGDSQDQLFTVLSRISDVLQSQKYDFINLSVGPDLPIEDNDIHVWTAVLDPLLSSGHTLATIAVGNEGENDRLFGNARIQSPSDCVNGLAVGSSNSQGTTWGRAPYSCIGPGRSPGLIKPDVLDFGGSKEEPFWVLHPSSDVAFAPKLGTSFASPNALRKAIGLRAHLGKDITPLATRALLLHRCEQGNHDLIEVGRGRVLSSIEELITCEDDMVHVIYQGELEPKKWLRARVPVPEGLTGYVDIKATICFACEVDPQDSMSYTRGGIEYLFRPHDGKTAKGSKSGLAKTKSFRPKKIYRSEQELRDDWHKWEPVFSHSERVRGDNLSNPVFDIHYMPRRSGADVLRAEKIPYAMVITVHKKGLTDLYNRVVQRYRLLQPLRPVIDIQVRT